MSDQPTSEGTIDVLRVFAVTLRIAAYGRMEAQDLVQLKDAGIDMSRLKSWLDREYGKALPIDTATTKEKP